MEKIAIINVAGDYGGAEKSILDLSKELIKEYQAIFVLTNKYLEKEVQNDFRYHSVKSGSFKSIFGIFNLFRTFTQIYAILLKEKPDIILTNNVRSHIVGALVSLLFRSKCFWIMRDYQFNKFFYNLLKVIPSNIIFISRQLKDFYSKEKNYPIIPNIVNLSNSGDFYFEENKSDIEYCRILNVSNFSKLKGLEFIIYALHELLKKGYACQLTLAGRVHDAYYLNYLKGLTESLALSEYVFFPGYIENTQALYRSSDIIISSTISKYGGPESFGRTIIEAWQTRKPIIATNVGGPREIITHRQNGLLVREESPEEIANAVIKILNDGELTKKIIQNEKLPTVAILSLG
ncbi:MAG: glycosyltransferase family 4 protein, partial [Nanoarchaeota archaeon]